MASPRAAASELLTESTPGLLNVIATKPGITVSGLAQRLAKDPSNVSRSLQRLAGHGLVKLVREGREVRPELVPWLRVVVTTQSGDDAIAAIRRHLDTTD